MVGVFAKVLAAVGTLACTKEVIKEVVVEKEVEVEVVRTAIVEKS